MRRTCLATALVLVAVMPVQGATYEFLAAPEIDLNRIYRLDKATGEMGACQYGLVEDAASARKPPGASKDTANVGKDALGTSKDTTGPAKPEIGVTFCYPPGEGGGPQSQSEYALVASRHNKEGGVFRVDVRTGTMSICYVLNDTVVCTPPAR